MNPFTEQQRGKPMGGYNRLLSITPTRRRTTPPTEAEAMSTRVVQNPKLSVTPNKKAPRVSKFNKRLSITPVGGFKKHYDPMRSRSAIRGKNWFGKWARRAAQDVLPR